MNNNIAKFKYIYRYVSYKCATLTKGYSEVLILLKLRKNFKKARDLQLPGLLKEIKALLV
jgi:hypothetical protein